MDLNWDAIKAANIQIEKWRAKAQAAIDGGFPQEYADAFTAAVTNDLDTPKAIAVVREAEKTLNESAFADFLLWADIFFGLDLEREPKQLEVPQSVTQLIEQRNVARVEKDFAKSDQIRDEIFKLGFAVKDTPSGTEVEPLN